MKKDFMWYYTVIWLLLGGLSCLWEVFTLSDADSFWGLAIMLPTIIWLFSKGSK